MQFYRTVSQRPWAVGTGPVDVDLVLSTVDIPFDYRIVVQNGTCSIETENLRFEACAEEGSEMGFSDAYFYFLLCFYYFVC